MTFWAAGSEPEALRRLAIGDGINPEDYGVDFLWINRMGKFIGVQRKTCSDLAASLMDGRMGTGLAKGGDLDKKVLLIEGDWKWDSSGNSSSVRGFHRTKLRGVELSAQMQGMIVVHTSGLMDTAAAIPQLRGYFDHETHDSLYTRPKAKGKWGRADSQEWRWHWWQSHDGIGLGQAKKLDDHFSGKLPVVWTVESIKHFEACPGIGRKRAQTLWDAYLKVL